MRAVWKFNNFNFYTSKTYSNQNIFRANSFSVENLRSTSTWFFFFKSVTKNSWKHYFSNGYKKSSRCRCFVDRTFHWLRLVRCIIPFIRSRTFQNLKTYNQNYHEIIVIIARIQLAQKILKNFKLYRLASYIVFVLLTFVLWRTISDWSWSNVLCKVKSWNNTQSYYPLAALRSKCLLWHHSKL